jgi:hypothetical protein
VDLRHRVDYCHGCNIYVHIRVVECSYFAEDVASCHGKSTPRKHEGDLPRLVTAYLMLELILRISKRMLTQIAERELRMRSGKGRRRRLELPGLAHNSIDFLPLEDISIQRRASVERIHAHHIVFPRCCCKRCVWSIRPFFKKNFPPN